jgi:UDP-N-acetylglucosamine transferase subunit ALG13
MTEHALADKTAAVAATKPVVLVMLGTDVHHFDRLVGWADDWATRHPDVRVVVQHGFSEAPRVADSRAFFPIAELRELAASANAVVCHGGPGTVADARLGAHVPLVVPRDPERGEHIDDHQQRYARWATDKGIVRAVSDVSALDAVVESSLVPDDDLPSPAEQVDRSAIAMGEVLADWNAHQSLPTAPDAPVTLFIGGSGRSGSTLLERLLEQVPGVVALGEVVHLWTRGIRNDELCACGNPFSACEFWTSVGRRAFGGWDQVDVDRVLELKSRVDRQRRIPLTALRHTTATFRKELLEYADHYRRIYAAARDVVGAQVVVDSSKHASTALALSHDRGIDLRTVRIVRDPRGVAYSWSKSVERPETDGEVLMPRYSPVTSTALWTAQNVGLGGLAHRGLPVATVRYEDLVVDPALHVERLWQTLGLPGTGVLPVATGNTVDLGVGHSVAGNPMRFRQGLVSLASDDTWKRSLSASDRRLVTALSLPALVRYGYLGRGR